MTERGVLVGQNEIKPRISYAGALDTLSLRDLRKLMELRYVSHLDFGKKIGWGKCAVSRFLTGDWIPKDPKVIRRISEELGIDVIVLTQMLERVGKEVKNESN